MATSFKRFFDMPELIELLAGYLDHTGISLLSQTNRFIHDHCLPLLHRDLDFLFGAAIKLFYFVPSVHALSRNTQHVRILEYGPYELSYYYNCVLAFEEINSPAPDRLTAVRLNCLPPPDIHTCQVIPLPPMTRLSQLSLTLSGWGKPPYEMPSVNDPQVLFAQMCWLISLNPFLTVLELRSFTIKDGRSCRLLGGAISGLSMLERLDVSFSCLKSDMWRLGLDLFSYCPQSIQHLAIDTDEDYDLDGQINDDMDSDEESMLAVQPCNQKGLLLDLHNLILWNITEGVSIDEILSVFARCPNIKILSIPYIARHLGADTIGRYIGQECPKIESLVYGLVGFGAYDPLPFRIIGSLPPHQVTKFDYRGSLDNINNINGSYGLLWHSTSLCSISITNHSPMDKISLAAILKLCFNLEELLIECHSGRGHYVTLEDVLKSPWLSTRLTNLKLSISGCQMPIEPGVLPYYRRPTPITLTNAETHHLAQLERLYEQIGALTDLHRLDLSMVQLDEQSREIRRNPESFPAMLSLKDPRTGRPGFLHHLAGLTKLMGLYGSVRADSDETKETMEWREAIWIDEHWPQLSCAAFFNHEKVRAPFEWLKNRRSNGQQRLSLIAY